MQKLFGLILFLNLSEGFRPLGVIIGISSSSILSTLTFLISIVYVLFFKHQLLYLLRFRIFKWLFNLLLIYPIISLFFSFFFNFLEIEELLYWFSFNSMFSLLMIASSIFTLNINYNIIRKMAILSLLICLIGFISNYYFYSFTRAVLAFSSSGAASQEKLFRAISFYPNPNTAALSINIYLMLFFFKNKTSNLINVIIILLSAGMIFLTGSRTSLVLFCFILMFYFVPAIVYKINLSKRLSISLAYLRVSFITLFMCILMILFFSSISTFFETNMNSVILDRMNFFGDLISSDNNGFNDKSLTARTEILPKYIKEIENNPIFGYGPQIIRNKLSTGFFENVSQNAFIEGAITYGIPYSIFYLITLVLMYINSRSFNHKKDGNYNILGAFSIFLFLVSFSINNVFWIRAVVIALGLIVGYYIKQLKMPQNYKAL